MVNRVIHSMPALIIAKTEAGQYVIQPADSGQLEIVPIEKFHRCIFPEIMLDRNGLLKEGITVQCVRVENNWVYPNHNVYNPKKL